MGIFFSSANFYHAYYLTMLAPAICALSGIGVPALWRAYQRPGTPGWLLPVALVATAVVQAMILSHFSVWSAWMTPIVVGWCLIAALILTVARLQLPLSIPATFLAPAIILGMLTLVLAPTVWDAVTLQHPPNATLPTAGPRPSHPGGILADLAPAGSSEASDDVELEHYLLRNLGKTRYLLAVLIAPDASSLILETGQPVMALGGFTGSDPILTTRQLSTLISNHTVRFFLLPGAVDSSLLPAPLSPQLREILANGGRSSEMLGPNGQLVQWVQRFCVTVAQKLWQSSQSPFSNQQRLYDCQST
jgi:4-amino-4-deoxy-L-arabinose transferase-like glycosyltransferase